MKLRTLAGWAAAAFVAGGVVLSAAADLPAGYTQVPFIKANGNCQVRTGLVPTSADKVEMTWRPMTVSGNQNLWCSRNGSGTSAQFTAFMIGNKIRIDRNEAAAGQKTSTGALLACTNYTIVADFAAGTCVVTNVAANTEVISVPMADTASFTPGSELCLFGSHTSGPDAGYGNPASYDLYSFKLKDSAGNLRCDLVPARRDADGLYGLYDLARSTFLTNCNSGVFTTGGITITPEDPLWGKTLTIADDITIDAGEGAAWQGAITVYDGGSLKTRGNLNVAGTTLIYANGTVTVETGSSYFTFAANYIRGNLTVNAGAELRMNITEAFQGTTTAVFHLYGTLNCLATRQRIDGGKFFFHDGSRVIGTGDAYGALYAYRNGRIVFDGTVEIEPPIAGYNGYTFTAACCENAHVSFKGGIKANSSNQNTANFVQDAATAEEGNPLGTCANAFVEIGPCAYSGTLDFKGPITLVSNAKIALANASPTFTVTTSGTLLEFVADKATAYANHATAQTLPAITTSTATVRLTGDGVVALRDAEPAFPIEFGGASLAIAADAPVALAAGSSVTAPTTVGVDGLAANASATLFTGADSSFDVSKLSVRPAHNGVLMGTAAAATLSGTDVVTAGVAAYDATAWIRPYIEATALVWLDASDAANFVFKDNTFGFVTTWRDRSSYKRDATAYTIASHDPNWGTLSVTNGVPAYCMGACDSGIDLSFSVRMTTIRTVFWAMSICQDSRAFFLGDSSSYHFHRGGKGEYCYNNNSAIWKNGKIYCDGVLVTANLNTLVPTDRHVYSTVTAAACASNRLTLDRTSGSSIRHAGRELSELIAFDVALADADREAVEAYLAAKWMGANPTAAGTAGTYAVKGDLEVDDTISGTQNLDFAEGASVSISNPSSSEPMLSTTGTVTLPAGSPLAVSVDASALVPGSYTVMQATSGITSLSQFAPTATVGAGATATFAVVDGKLTMTIAVSSSATSQTWRPASSADLGWNQASANWLYDGGTTGGFIPYVPAFIDGAEAATGDITVTGTQTAGPITLTGANDYTFKGDGTLAGGDTITFGGTGTITLDGASFGDQTIVIANGQKVVLGPNASQNALGTDSGSSGGKVEIAEGSQFNINYTGVASNNTDPRAEITNHKTFSIAGDGPDGRGALVNDALDGRTKHDYYVAMLRRLELADDATIGGIDRIDMRIHTGASTATATPGIYGPDKTLTVKTSIFCPYAQPIDVGSIVVKPGAMLLPANYTASILFNVPGGVVIDGGTLQLYNSTYRDTMPISVTANGGTFYSQGGAITVNGAVNVASGASLALTGDKNVTYSGAFNANGAEITHSNSAATYFNGPSAGNLSFTQTAGTIYAQGAVDGDVTVTKSGGSFFLGSGFSNRTVSVTQSGSYTGLYTGNTAPVFDEFNITTTGGEIYFQPQSTTTMIDVPGVINFGSIGQNVYVFGPAGNKGMKLTLKGTTTGKFAVGLSSGRPATLHLKSGTDFTVKDLDVGAVNTASGQGEVIVESGAKVKATNRIYVGCYGTAPTALANHRMDIYGEVDGSDVVVAAQYDQPRGEIVLHEGGLLKAKQLYAAHTRFKYGNGVGITNGLARFTMEGGRFELGASGFTSAAIVPGVVTIDIRNGTFVNVAAWTSMPYAMPVYFGFDTLGGSVDYDLGAYNVSWNSGIAGASDLTIKGAADFAGNRAAGGIVQGAMLGRLTVENTGANDLRNASTFSGGLTLADGVNAQVAKYADEHYPYAVAGNYREDLSTNEWSLAYVAGADIWPFLHKRYSSGKPYGNTWSMTTRCTFYVPEEKAGTWTFCGAYDDYMFVQIDGVTVFNQVYNALAAHPVTLAAGWHKMIIATYDGSGSAGPPASNGWNDGKSLGFIIGESSSTAGGDYTKFEPGASLGDGLTLQVRPAVNVCVWKWNNTNSGWNTTEDWKHIKCIDSVEYMHLTGGSQAEDTLGYFGNKKANCFQGWFKVEDGQEGEWTFKMAYDDYKLLKIDGVQKISSTSASAVPTATMTLTAGWHRWEARVGDNTGGWGPRTYNGGKALSYIAPGEAEKRFDETNLKLAATLGDVAVLEPSGIYRDLELGAGSTLTSAGTMAMPIFGTLKGMGTLSGPFAFAGDVNCWEVEGVYNSRSLSKAAIADATGATFAGLKEVKATFDRRPVCSEYPLTDAAVDGIADVDLSNVRITVTGDGKDYSEKFSLGVSEGRLVLKNKTPGGMVMYIR